MDWWAQKERKRGAAPVTHLATAGVFLLATAWGVAALAQSSPPGADTDPVITELRKRIEAREAEIKNLARRLGELERRMKKQTSTQPPAAAGEVRPAAVPPAQAALPMPPATSGSAKTAQRQTTPGGVEVDEEAAERALERTLTAEGALLMPSGRLEMDPSLTYTRRESDVGGLFTVSGGVAGGTRTTERDELTAGLDFRLGLPFDSQLEFGIPYRVIHQSAENATSSAILSDNDTWGHGLGDFSVGIAKTLLRERDWRPDVIGRLTYDSSSGQKSNNGVSLGGGYHDVRASVTALKRQDPLAFVGTLSYQRSLESENSRPGDEYGFTLLALLAASPETSLRFGIQQTFIDEQKSNGSIVSGSDELQSMALFGFSSILGRGLFVNVTMGAGLTDDAPDYFLGISVPIRFGIWTD